MGGAGQENVLSLRQWGALKTDSVGLTRINLIPVGIKFYAIIQQTAASSAGFCLSLDKTWLAREHMRTLLSLVDQIPFKDM